ncbi:MAG: hypothetical protein KGD59_11300 [Candidatus Heimdallarchaeota archaeon]|nr:hypothetical protein [Candidatus Heimdallarchaeota archaeon]MBY8995128.1 hypothetical protein [Candidatus Heimdallarchaeota archaeon]
MKDEIAQIMSLVAYGNAYLKGKPVSYDKNHPAGFHYHNIRFVERIPKDLLARKAIIAEDPNKWFRFLKDNKYNRLYLSFQPSSSLGLKDHISSAFVGGGCQWNIIAEKGDKCDVWQTKWQVEFGDLKVYYFQLFKNIDLPKITKTTVEQAKLYLKEILKDMIDFTVKNELANWEKVFQSALNLLPVEESYKLLQNGFLPEGCFKIEAEQILTACDQAWVFGGMGSWNDVVRVKDYDLYTRLSANLYDTLCKAMIAAINSYP